jgi:uroporphyrinogen-III decarboxylase
MTNRERMLAIMAGRSPDRIPWIPRPEIWYEARRRMGTLPAKYSSMTLNEIRHALRMGTWINTPVYRTELHGVEVRKREVGRDLVEEYITPVGAVTTRYRRSEKLERLGMSGQEVEKMIKGPADYRVVEYIYQHAEVVPIYDEFLAVDKELDDDGYPMSPCMMDPLSELMLTLVGYNDVYYHLHDYPDLVGSLSETLAAHAEKVQQVVLDSPARLVMCGSHFSSMMTPPRIFRQMMPFYQSFADRLHRRDKLMVCHADADSSTLLELFVEAGYDLMDSFVTAPMVPVTLERARAVFGNKVTIWGGLPSILLCDPTSDEEFEAYMRDLFRIIAPGDAFILAVADNIMMESKVERLERVADMVDEYGAYPIRAG